LSANEKMPAKNVAEGKQNASNRAITNATWMIVFATAANIGIAALTWSILHRADVDIGRQLSAMASEQRPWIKVGNIDVPEMTFWKPSLDFPKGRIDVKINAKFTNVGKSPADDIEVVPLVVALGAHAPAGVLEAARKVLTEKLRAGVEGSDHNRFLFPGDSFDEKELPATTNDLDIPGTLDFNSNDLVSIHILVGVRYRLGSGIGWTITPVDLSDTMLGGAIHFQLSAMRNASPSYKVGTDYFVRTKEQGIEAH
jgi:hypothetical protein